MSFICNVIKYMYKIVYILYYFLVRIICKVNSKKVVFFSIPDYADNARALSEYLMSSNRSTFDVVWIVEDRNNLHLVDGCKSYVRLNRFGIFKLRTLYHMMTAKYVCSTHKFPLPYSKKLKEQVYVRLWHGCGYKDKTSRDGTHKVCDVAMVPGPLFIKPMAYFWNMNENDIIDLGYPRYDWLLKRSYKASSYMSQLKENAKKSVIWMPTFRNDKNGVFNETSEQSSFPLINDVSCWRQLDSVCRDNNILLLIKLHVFQTDYDIPFAEMTNVKSLNVKDYMSKGLPLYEVISETDALITDYSSVAIDYLVLDRPIAFCLDDFELYKKNRGFVFEDPLQYMPGHHLYNVEDLKCFIHDVAVGNDTHADERRRVRSVAVKESECYCETVWNKITSL